MLLQFSSNPTTALARWLHLRKHFVLKDKQHKLQQRFFGNRSTWYTQHGQLRTVSLNARQDCVRQQGTVIQSQDSNVWSPFLQGMADCSVGDVHSTVHQLQFPHPWAPQREMAHDFIVDMRLLRPANIDSQVSHIRATGEKILHICRLDISPKVQLALLQGGTMGINQHAQCMCDNHDLISRAEGDSSNSQGRVGEKRRECECVDVLSDDNIITVSLFANARGKADITRTHTNVVQAMNQW